MEDAFAIKLLDRFIRRIYKVRQSDRNRIVRQLKTILKDSGNYHVLRLDIKDCYESIKFESLIKQLEDDLILVPKCIKLLNDIHGDLLNNHGMEGLPRGLSISSTLAELYLETLDKEIAAHPDVIYAARYVDDIIILTPANKEEIVERDIEFFLNNEINLTINKATYKYYSNPSSTAEFDYLGYEIKVESRKGRSNKITLKISQSKLNKLKSRIIKSLCDHKKEKNIPLLKRRLEYLCMLKNVRKNENGDLLAGIHHNYRYVTDSFDCLKPVDGFLCKKLDDSRFGLSQPEKDKIKKISIYGNVIKRNIGNFSNKQTVQIMRIWKNA